ncbi:unnamed protein product [Symbiodinium pilosum]|uniref:Uncharacterized protein n=1 Tax=Symbiodinium pilosum TaxID=2952 RepID=A0A812UY19_SYMPI|nr:unnamed protein product [Symbiodinium pilosum]
MRILFALLAFATSMRVEVFNQTQLPKGGKGEKCSCNKDPVAKQDCCAAGLVCSKLRKCQPALGSPCEKSAFHKVFGGSECSSSSYQERHSKRKIICQPKPEGKSVCCVKKGSVYPAWIPDGEGSFSLCCSGRGYMRDTADAGKAFLDLAKDTSEHVCYED